MHKFHQQIIRHAAYISCKRIKAVSLMLGWMDIETVSSKDKNIDQYSHDISNKDTHTHTKKKYICIIIRGIRI